MELQDGKLARIGSYALPDNSIPRDFIVAEDQVFVALQDHDKIIALKISDIGEIKRVEMTETKVGNPVSLVLS